MSWYAIKVPAGEEEATLEKLHTSESENKFLILKRVLRERKSGEWRFIERLVFPGYVFMTGAMNHEGTLVIDDKRSLTPVNEKFSVKELESDEIEIIEMLDKKRTGLIDISEVQVQNNDISVIRGALMGLEDKIVSINKRKGRAKVNISLCGAEKIIELGVNPGTW